MNETKLLPCPVCGYNAEVYENSCVTGRKYVSCQNNECDVSGPFADDKENAVKKWNAIPRVLKWTDDPPRKDGWYWIKHNNDKQTIGHICIDLLQYDIADYLFAGPIPEPIMPEDKQC